MQKGKQKMASYILLAIYIIFSSLGMVLIKSGASNSDISIKDNIFNMHVSLTFILGLLLYIVSFILWIFILQKFPLTYISRVSYGLVYIAIAIFSFLILNTIITKAQIIGAIFIIIGIFIASRS